MRTSLWTRGFVRLLGVRVASQAGDGLFQAGLAWLVLLSPEAQRSSGRFVLVLAIVLLPFSVLAPFVSLVLDRWLRRSILVTAQAVRAGVVASVALVAWLSAERADWPVYVLVLVALGFARLLLACLSASVPHVVAQDRLVDANTVGPTLGATAHATGLGAGALLLALGAGSPVVLVASTLLTVTASLLARGFGRAALGPDAGSRPPRPGDVLRDLADALAHLWSRRRASAALLTFGALRVAYGGFTLLAFAATAGRGDDAEAAVAAAGVAAGFALGAVSTPWLAHRLGIGRWTVVAGAVGLTLLTAPALVGGGTVTAWFVQAFAFGLVHQVWKIRTDTVVQREVDEQYLGRVFVLYDVLNNITYVAGAALAALLVA
ncbi:MFS transporter [Mumia sp. ZJ1417]|uniref:MFS transporter n=1 Tax=Mumia sp. ZJ1417 TaxID=2708082 RepID=UPI00141EB102|nr:MFS transporter [Mumia sp. ZJ1417]QMW66414.1 MFS transporter [Mumia sp. ZJ1417]